MSDVVTVFCCGTAFSRIQNDAIAYTYQVTKGRKWINDGPGSSLAPMKAEAILKKVESGKGVKDKAFSKTHTPDGIGGQAFGRGTQDNIIVTLQWLWEQYYEKPFTTINLAGWSRGAVTCIMLAHAIQEAGFGLKEPTLKVNIFAFDPVPGLANDFKTKGTFDKTGRIGSPDQLPSIVGQYESILMEHVQGMGGFKPMMFKSVSPRILPSEVPPKGKSSATTKTEYPMPGNHGTCVMYAEKNNPVAQISLHLLHDHLIRNGTELQFDDRKSARDLLELYAEARLQYSVLDGKKLAKQKAQKVRAKLIINEYRNDVLVVNGHHYQLFTQELPLVWAQIAKHQPLTDAMKIQLLGQYPTTYHVLEASGALED